MKHYKFGKKYFFYSKKQDCVIRDMSLVEYQARSITNKCLINGLFGTKLFAKIEPYTECGNTKIPSGNWNDYVYLGRGWIYEVDGIRQR